MTKERPKEERYRTFKVTNWEELIEAEKATQNTEKSYEKSTLVLFATVLDKVPENGKPYTLKEFRFARVPSCDMTDFMGLLSKLCQQENEDLQNLKIKRTQ